MTYSECIEYTVMTIGTLVSLSGIIILCIIIFDENGLGKSVLSYISIIILIIIFFYILLCCYMLLCRKEKLNYNINDEGYIYDNDYNNIEI
jgi:hypothetical protein